MGATCGAGTAYLSWGSEFSLGFFCWIRATGSPVLCVCFVDRFLSFCTFSIGHCVASSFSIYGFLLPLWYLQTLLIKQYFVSTIDSWSNKLVILRNEKQFVYIALLMTIIWWNWTHFRCIVTIYRYKYWMIKAVVINYDFVLMLSFH